MTFRFTHPTEKTVVTVKLTEQGFTFEPTKARVEASRIFFELLQNTGEHFTSQVHMAVWLMETLKGEPVEGMELPDPEQSDGLIY